jgi:hypothetical protein
MIHYISAPNKRDFKDYCRRNKINRGGAVYVPRDSRRYRDEILRNVVFDASVVLVGPFTSAELAAGNGGTMPTVVPYR